MFRNKKPPSVANAATAMTAAPENGTDRKKRRSIRGSARRRSHQISPMSAATDAAKAATITGDPHPRSGASMIP